MKKIIIAFAVTILPALLFAQQVVVKIAGTRLAYPLFRQWISEYNKIHPGTIFIINSNTPADSADILIASYAVQSSELKAGKQLLAVSRYVQLPVVNAGRNDLATLQEKGFTTQNFRQVYFAEGANNKPDAFSNLFTVYTREKPACATKAFATHFGNQTGDIHGVGVSGDDQSLLDAVKKNPDAISYNNAGFIYNHETRKVNDSIAVIPIDINENGKIDTDEKIYETLDQLIDYAEHTNSSKLLIENVNVIVNRESLNQAVKDFLHWVIANGQQYNRHPGFLQLKLQQQEDEQAILAISNNADDLDALYGKQN